VFRSKTYQLHPHPPAHLPWSEYAQRLHKEWVSLLDSSESAQEANVQEFLECHPCMLPGPFGLLGESGHHPYPGAVITQPVLQGLDLKRPDFLWLAQDSGTLYPVLIEIETPHKKWFTQKEVQHADLTKGLTQLATWRAWLERPENRAIFLSFYNLPLWMREKAFHPIFVLVHGRAKEFEHKPRLNAMRLQLSRQNEVLMTFDRLVPQEKARELWCVKKDQDNYCAVSVPPVTTLGPNLASYRSIIRNRDCAIAKSEWLGSERKTFLTDRLGYWDEWTFSGGSGIRSTSDTE